MEIIQYITMQICTSLYILYILNADIMILQFVAYHPIATTNATKKPTNEMFNSRVNEVWGVWHSQTQRVNINCLYEESPSLSTHLWTSKSALLRAQ